MKIEKATNVDLSKDQLINHNFQTNTLLFELQHFIISSNNENEGCFRQFFVQYDRYNKKHSRKF